MLKERVPVAQIDFGSSGIGLFDLFPWYIHSQRLHNHCLDCYLRQEFLLSCLEVRNLQIPIFSYADCAKLCVYEI
jgi:hypothetical protein